MIKKQKSKEINIKKRKLHGNFSYSAAVFVAEIHAADMLPHTLVTPITTCSICDCKNVKTSGGKRATTHCNFFHHLATRSLLFCHTHSHIQILKNRMTYAVDSESEKQYFSLYGD